MPWCRAMSMLEVGQCFDDPALSDMPAHAACSHPLKFPFQRLQSPQPGIDFGDLGNSDRVSGRAVIAGSISEIEQGPDAVHGEAELPGVADEA